MTVAPHSPLAARHDAMRAAGERTTGALTLRELSFRAQLDVRAGAAARVRLESAGILLPAVPNTWTPGNPEAYWLGPDEWLLVGAADTQDEIAARVRAGLGDKWATLVDVSDQRVVLELSGAAARDVLAAGCALDLHPRAFVPGACAQTLLERAGVLLACVDDAPTYRLLVRSSFAGYAVDWLLDALEGAT